jgi:pimeloyl-ACP methyl ester carboxylesterase
MEDHGTPAEEVQRLGPFGPHTGSFAGGQNHGGKTALLHQAILSSPVDHGAFMPPDTVQGVMPYDEFGLFSENAAEYDLPFPGPPEVRRVDTEVGPGRHVSSLVWGTSPPELVLVHGGAQNAHTWDTVALALDRPLLAIDLPGHGHSDGGPDGSLSVTSNGADLARVVEELAPAAAGVVGMSLGGLSSIALAAHAPALVRALVLIDVTPGVNQEKAAPITNFVNGPASFPSFDEILARTIEHNPGRSESSLRRGILHNAVQREDGSWVWRYARFREGETGVRPEFADLWQAISALTVPLMLVRGLAWSVVDDDDVAELLRRQPEARVVGVEGAGHSIQGDRPLELAALLSDFLFPPG